MDLFMKVIIMYYIKIKWIFTIYNMIRGTPPISGSCSPQIYSLFWHKLDSILFQPSSQQIKMWNNRLWVSSDLFNIIGSCIFKFSAVKSEMMENEWISVFCFYSCVNWKILTPSFVGWYFLLRVLPILCSDWVLSICHTPVRPTLDFVQF